MIDAQPLNIPYLNVGDTVAIIAPAGKIEYNTITDAIALFKEWGLKVWIGKNIKKEHTVFAGTDIERAQDLQFALDSPKIKAIICARGGYGTIRTLDYINWTGFLKNPKLICGFSDITVIHSFLSNKGIYSLHSLMPLNFPKATIEAIDTFKNAIFGQKISHQLPTHELNRKGESKGFLTGGNLSILLALRGTSYEPDYQGKILFLEDVGETHYHLDRMLQNLKNSIFKQIKGLVVGQFSEMKDGKTSFGKEAFAIIAEAAQHFNFPIIFDFPAGHVEDNRALWMNREVSLSVSEEKSSLIFH